MQLFHQIFFYISHLNHTYIIHWKLTDDFIITMEKYAMEKL